MVRRYVTLRIRYNVDVVVYVSTAFFRDMEDIFVIFAAKYILVLDTIGNLYL